MQSCIFISFFHGALQTDLRIRFQGLTLLANRLPQPDQHADFARASVRADGLAASSPSPSHPSASASAVVQLLPVAPATSLFAKSAPSSSSSSSSAAAPAVTVSSLLAEAQAASQGLMDDLCRLQAALAAQNPTVPTPPAPPALPEQQVRHDASIDETISFLCTSQTINDQFFDSHSLIHSHPYCQSTAGYCAHVSELVDGFSSYRNDVIEKWNRKTQLAAGGAALTQKRFKAINQVCC